jgi:hypothetical protein
MREARKENPRKYLFMVLSSIDELFYIRWKAPFTAPLGAEAVRRAGPFLRGNM